MHLHILGICGTFMGGLALIARELGHSVSGQDQHVYPPMSEQLAAEGVAIIQGYHPEEIPPETDLVIVGNALSRGVPVVEWLLNRRVPFTSGPQWLWENLLAQRWVIAIAGTHGKTTTAAMVATIIDHAGFDPGFLIGGVPLNFGLSARCGSDPFFVIEADEYDTAFFDKRSKFLHYHPQSLILNNLEFDHADIFDDLAAIERQFHHLIRTVPGSGKIFAPRDSEALQRVLNQGCWSSVEWRGEGEQWHESLIRSAEGEEQFTILHQQQAIGTIRWRQSGEHNRANGVMAVAAAHHAGLTLKETMNGLSTFRGVKRRMELRGEVAQIEIYDDFAHHPTAIATTLEGIRRQLTPGERLIAVVEPRSNTMRLGVHRHTLIAALAAADCALIFRPDDAPWLDEIPLPEQIALFTTTDAIVTRLSELARPGDKIVIMSNGSFANLHQRTLAALTEIHLQ
ncbi:MAG: UDP-N-acetylmuramate:L-alanyl-gamma-D-glutamyl-meso-diaminopimelate ligase [Gammaproteobacteria bacterium]|nr:UDP-N-acetylmuramate:L-alanyl-gamma-D-glutamyl-meso-diaminopimelate ligase [Gammaproteobacteria bacterium]